MKTYKLLSIVILLFAGSQSTAQVKSNDLLPHKPVNWTEKQLIQPSALAAIMANNKIQKPVIFNMGVVEDIPGAVRIGAASDEKNIQILKEKLKALPKNTQVVVYCGCCPYDKCPNIRPAFQALISSGFVNGKVLNLPTNIKTDWINKGFPYTK
jgi:hypothetical protein